MGPPENAGAHRLGFARAGGYRLVVARTLILSDETIRNLVEAHASLAAWYYQMSDALRSAGAEAAPPTDEQRRAFVEQVAIHYPEVADVARSIDTPRLSLPPPGLSTPGTVVENEGVEIKEPPKDMIETPAMVPQPEPKPPATASESPAVASEPPAETVDSALPSDGAEPPEPPPMVDPSKVKYEE